MTSGSSMLAMILSLPPQASLTARAGGRAVGSYARDVEMGNWLIDLGVQYLSINVDATIYLQACEKIAKALK